MLRISQRYKREMITCGCVIRRKRKAGKLTFMYRCHSELVVKELCELHHH